MRQHPGASSPAILKRWQPCYKEDVRTHDTKFHAESETRLRLPISPELRAQLQAEADAINAAAPWANITVEDLIRDRELQARFKDG
jgi:hypothetical protein